jgi:tight adherence protein B
VVPTSIPWLLPVVLVVAFLGLFMLFAVGFTPETWGESNSQRGTRRIQRYAMNAVANRSDDEAAPAASSQVALAWAARTVARRGVEESWRMELDRAAVPLRAPEWLIVRLAVTLASGAVGALFLPLWLVTAPLAGLTGWFLAGGYVRFKAKRRLNRFAENLPDVLQLIAGSLRTGFSLPQAVDNAAKDGEQPMAGELSRALAESRLGVDLEDALDRVADRMRSTDLSWTVMAVRIAREVGGNLAEVLMSTAETMRERARIHRQVKVLSAEGRLSAYILIGLPIGITIFLVLFRRAYVAPLVTDPIGLGMVTYGVISVLIGTWWMSRLIKLEV